MKVSSIRWGVIWIGIGFLFLAINFGVLDKLVFPALFSLWPILLIAVGVELIFRKTRFYFLALLSPLLVAAAFIFAAVYAGGYSWSFSEFWKDWSWTYEGEKRFTEEISLGLDVDTLRLEMELGQSEFEIRPTPEMIFSVDANYYRISPLIGHRGEGPILYLNYRNRESENRSIFNLKPRDIRNEFELFDDVWLYADIETGNDYPKFDFSDFLLKGLMLSLEARETKIGFGEKINQAGIEINGRSERLILLLPENYGLELNMDDPDIERLKNPEGFYEYPNGLRSDNYPDADRKVSISLNLVVKKIDVRRK